MLRPDAPAAAPHRQSPAAFIETIPGYLVAEFDEYPDDDTTIDLAREIREAEGRLS